MGRTANEMEDRTKACVSVDKPDLVVQTTSGWSLTSRKITGCKLRDEILGKKTGSE